jgi:hypothetical protein
MTVNGGLSPIHRLVKMGVCPPFTGWAYT